MKSSFARRTAIAAAFAAPVAVQAASFNEPSGGYGTVPYGDITLSWSGDEGSVRRPPPVMPLRMCSFRTTPMMHLTASPLFTTARLPWPRQRP